MERLFYKLTYVTQAIPCNAFVLKVERQLDALRFHLHDLRTGQKLVFANWEELESYVVQNAQRKIH